MVETQENLVPTGKVLSVKDTEYDFLSPKKIAGQPLDTPYVIDPKAEKAVTVSSKKSGISMEVRTNQPAVVVYTPPFFPGICFETQNYPDAPNQKNFPNCILRPNEVYLNDSKFSFYTDQ